MYTHTHTEKNHIVIIPMSLCFPKQQQQVCFDLTKHDTAHVTIVKLKLKFI